ncbi:DNA-binding response regulator, OmpR family, contains REC and winged-helix (wHTH) domain [Variovorax sp. 770b2]|nr:DNA-binding response regulator, OmpR family, contains REC and winged-helix (wHTH) domain [Variovorax sp. 770b2]
MTVRLRGPLSLALLEEKNAHGPAVQHRLETAGHRVVTFASAADLLAALGCGQRFDLLLLASPDEVTHSRLRAACEVPGLAILVIPQGAPWKGLPSWNAELVRRKHAVLRRRDSPVREIEPDGMVRGAYRFVDTSGTVLLAGREIHLSPQTFAFASALFRNADTVLTREWLWRSIWNAPPQREVGRVIDVCAANLRKKLALDAGNGFVLRAVYGTGYKLVTVAPGSSDERDPQGESHAR